MPHIIVEYSADLDDRHNMQMLCQALFDAARDCSVFPDPSAIKVRATPCQNWVLDGSVDGFVHVTVRLMKGREAATQAIVTNALLAVLGTRLVDVGSLTVDINDIDPATYAKRTL